jgi:MYXO-CTERM domain-containing protein
MALPLLSGRPPFIRPVAVIAGLLAGASFMSQAGAGNTEPPQCLSPDPSQWPAPAKPYFMLAVDTSSSMAESLPFPCSSADGGVCPPPAACPTYPGNRNGSERCALQQTVQAFGGQVNFGLSGMALQQSGCTPTCNCDIAGPFSCFTNCTTYTPYTGDTTNGCGPATNPIPGLAAATRQGANILVPMLEDQFWLTAPPTCTLGSQCPSGICTAGACATTNVPTLLKWFDNDCTANQEIWAQGKDPLNGLLQDMYRYFSGTYVIPGTATAIPTPLDPTNERACRSVNVILITAGDENCDTYADATATASLLFSPGVTVGNFTWQIRTHVIAFVGGKNSAVIAGNGASSTQTGTTAGNGYYANPTDSVALSQALANIIGSAIQPEVCDNVDNNCNGCTDEGFSHYCDVSQPCCNLARATCLANYEASITATNLQGDVTQLPCTSTSAGATPATWLCNNPGDICDGLDNNCNGVIDEGATKCGNPLHCPQPEVCNGLDDNCNGVIDEAPDGGAPYSICPNRCVPTPEICDGCDNNCDGAIDNGIAPLGSCGVPPNPPQEPAYCAGTLVCVPGATNVTPGSCNGTGGVTQCNYPAPGPQPETCNGIDDNCNGIVDEGIPSAACIPAGAPAGLVYNNTFPLSRCQMGQTQCINGATQCVGWIGPVAEVCNGVDDDCDGIVDDHLTSGIGLPCGSSIGTCKPGMTACVSGAITCQGGVGPTKEICDGLDNDCNGLVDDGTLADAPPNPGCWDLPGNCCSYTGAVGTTTWCPPSGGGVTASCTGLGTLTSPCLAGALACAGSQGWVCKGSRDPTAEVCNGIDDNCNGVIDEGPLPPPVGLACGSNIGACVPGVNVCVNGEVVCNGKGPTPEVCNGIDDNCNGVIDENIPGTGVACPVMYDTTAYPGNRNFPPCHPGVTQCNGALGLIVCLGGVGPQPEVCNGVDDNCNGVVDEMGTPPNGITGTANPTDPTEVIGQQCGSDVGVCKYGAWACSFGAFVCAGGVLPSTEKCNCLDNDCNGVVGNENPGNNPPLCSTGKTCVQSSFGCACAAPCGTGEFPCPGGQTCASVTVDGGAPAPGQYCVPNPCPDCAAATTTDASGNALCAPAGTPPDATTCVTPPVCTCAGQNGCQTPCYGVVCGAGTVCTNYGANAGQCVVDNCFNNPCPGCGMLCVAGACKTDPCTATTCPANQECLPSPDYTTSSCVAPCANVTCTGSQVCVDGKCAATCSPACAAGQVCDTSQSPPACVADKCATNPCTGSTCCNSVTGACGNCPCDGIVCPSGSICQAGQCLSTSMSTSSASASGSTSGSTSTSTSSSGGGGAGGATGVFGLATGGGGCSCVTAGESGSRRTRDGSLALAALALAVGLRRRRDTSRAARRRGEVAR